MSQTNTVGKHRTNVFYDEGWRKVVYHSTCVIKWNQSEIVLDSGGWQTSTTKNRINQSSNQFNLGISLWQKDYAWFVSINGDEKIEFFDGMTINRNTGEITND